MTAACLDEDTVFAFLQGALSEESRTDLEGHLSSCGTCSEVLTWAAAHLAAPSRTPGREGRPFVGQLAPGTFVDRYQILAPAGRGGMGEVYAAYHPDLDRRVAIKIVFERAAGAAERRGRLLREARAIARLSHPNVVTVHDAGTVDDRVYIAMEFVDGGTLDDWMAAETRTWREILNVFLDAGRGLAAAHAAGIIHRDFKPQNVMIGRDGSVRVTDFGLARLVSVVPETGPAEAASASESGGGVPDRAVITRMTKTGALIGTPAYMAPEQFRRGAGDARSDQFSFCVSLHEALFGERPVARVPGASDRVSPPPRNRELATRAARVPPWVRKAVMRGLSPMPAERWPSLSALLEALQKDPASRQRRWAAIGGAALLAVGAIVAVGSSLVGRGRVCAAGPGMLRGVWDLPSAGMKEPAQQARIHRAFLQTGKGYAREVFATVSDGLTAYARRWAAMYQETCEATHVRGDQSAEVLDLRMSCLKERLGGLQALTTVFAEATGEVVANAVKATTALGSIDHCADVTSLRAAIKPPEDPRTRERVEALRTQLASLTANYEAGRWKATLEQIDVVEGEAEATGYLPMVAEALMIKGRAEAEATQGAAEQTLVRAFWTADASKHDDIRARAAEALIYVLGCRQFRFREAEQWATAAHSVLRRIGGDELMEAWVINDLGTVYQAQGRLQEALDASLKAAGIKSKVLGPNHPDVAVSLANAAIALQVWGRKVEALARFDQSYAIFERTLGTDHPWVAVTLSNRADLLRQMGRLDDARAQFGGALEVLERELGPNNLQLALPLTGIGSVALDAHDPEGARAPLERAFKLREGRESDPRLRAETAFALARALWGSQVDHRRALQLAKSARADYSQTALKDRLAEVEAWIATHHGA